MVAAVGDEAAVLEDAATLVDGGEAATVVDGGDTATRTEERAVPGEHAAMRTRARATAGPRRMPRRYAADVERTPRLNLRKASQSPPLAPPVPAFNASTFATLGCAAPAGPAAKAVNTLAVTCRTTLAASLVVGHRPSIEQIQWIDPDANTPAPLGAE